MNITLSDVKIHPDMSEETVCFSAIILLVQRDWNRQKQWTGRFTCLLLAGS